MNVCYFGTYEKNYPRNSMLIYGLIQNDINVIECHVPLWEKTKLKGNEFGFSFTFLFQFLYAQLKLIGKYIFGTSKHDVIVIGYIGQLDIFLAKIFAVFGRKKLVFNPLISLYDTVISDRKYFPKKSIKARLFRFLDKSACRLSDIVILDTKSHIDYFKHELLLEDVKFELLPVGADERVFFPLNKENNKTFEVMFVGKFIPLHGIEMIVESANLLKNNLEIHFTLIGSGQLKKNIKEQITIHKLKNICLIDWIQYEELAQKMKEADLLLGIFGTSEKATHVVPNKVFQALAMKKPILTSDTPAIRELFTPDEHIFISQSNPVQIADKIQHICESEKMRILVAEKGYDYYNQNFTCKILGSKLKTILVNL